MSLPTSPFSASTTELSPERRRSVRYYALTSPRTRFLVQPGFQFGEGRLQDISAAGFCLLLNHPLALKTRLVVQLPGRRPGSSLSRTALVVRVQEEKQGSWLLGCQLNSPLSPEELSRLQTAVAGA